MLHEACKIMYTPASVNTVIIVAPHSVNVELAVLNMVIELQCRTSVDVNMTQNYEGLEQKKSISDQATASMTAV